MIDTQAALDALTDRLEQLDQIAIDCEMDSMYAYGTSLCLVQVGWDGHEELIDGLVDLDRARLGAVFADPCRVKIFHGGENDIGLMRAYWGFDFQNTFDTMAASQVLGHEGVGLAAVLDRYFEVKLSKKYQKADWRLRPLPTEQADYARLDVRYLIPLREQLLAQLVELGRVEEAECEFARIARANIPEKPFDPDNWVRVKGSKELPVTSRGRVRAVYVARDEIARAQDRAPFRVLHDSGIVELARRFPRTSDEYKKLRGVNRHLSHREVEQLLAAVVAGDEEGEIPLPPRKGRRKPWEPSKDVRLNPTQENAFDALRKWRGKRAEARGVDLARVATTTLLMTIARALPVDLGKLGEVAGVEPWRLREYGEDIIEVVRKTKA
jgi:ribonuclease D